MCRATIYDARNNFSSLVKVAEGGEPVELTRHDKPVAALISWSDYERTILREQELKEGFFERMRKLREEYADVLSDPTFHGLEIPKRELPDEEYNKKLEKLWEA